MEPPPSEAWAAGTIREATAAADPPLEPPAERVMSHGLRVGPKVGFCVSMERPSSGRLVLPKMTSPASRNHLVTSLSKSGTAVVQALPPEVGTPL